ncbi:MAG: hypothetical protein CMN32_11610 [Saprospirales bacterium]|nr:hypothetical protein [Saprospirales bacterium]
MKNAYVLLFLLFFSSEAISQVEWVSSDSKSQYAGRLFKTYLNQFVLIHSEFEGDGGHLLTVFDANGNIVFHLNGLDVDNEYTIVDFKDLINMPDSSVTLLAEALFFDPNSGTGTSARLIFSFDKEWNPIQQQTGSTFWTTDKLDIASDGSFIFMTTTSAGVSRVLQDETIWTKWLGVPCFDLNVTEGDTIVIATQNGVLLFDIDGNEIGQLPDLVYSEMIEKQDGGWIGVNGGALAVLSSDFHLLSGIDVPNGFVEDVHCDGDIIAVLTDSDFVFILNDSLSVLSSFELVNQGQFDCISINGDNVMLAGTERYGSDQPAHHTLATFVKEYSFDGFGFDLSNDIGIVNIGQPSSIEIEQGNGNYYVVFFRNIPVTIRNFGNKQVDSLVLRVYASPPAFIGDWSLQPGEEKIFVYDEVKRTVFSGNPSGNIYSLCFWTSHPDNLMDLDADNDYLCSDVLVNDYYKRFEDDIRVYPNPTTGLIHIECENGFLVQQIKSVSIFDSMGRMILERPFAYFFNFDFLKSGVYTLVFENELNNVVYRKRFLKLE